MRTLGAVLIAVIVAPPVWILGAMALNLLDVLRDNRSVLQTVFVDGFTAAVAAYIGLLVGARAVRRLNANGAFYGFSALVVIAAVGYVVMIGSLTEELQTGTLDWISGILTPAGALIGAAIARRTVLEAADPTDAEHPSGLMTP